ncbi:MAG TPA: hypothetical protein ENJ12_08020 [Thiolapillus brandeum]|uniref:Restriction system protein Mrr-like N-terminal domain-containing protein n=1 Tax=Thiolapillus brandeum TaxID=1076588 RepID=A0A831WAS2_9GAMM|nr:hypothetical protein [Thiolapillus brandeum]
MEEAPLDRDAVLHWLKEELGRLAETASEQAALHAQLKEVARSVERLQSQGHPIPDDLRRLKLDLMMRLEDGEQAAAELKQWAEGLRPLLASIDAVLTEARKSGNGPKNKGGRKRKQKVPRTNQEVLREYLLAALRELGGSASCSRVKDHMRERLAGRFLPGDLMKRKTGEIVWENNTHWERNALVKEGILKKNSPRGIWELAEREDKT